MTQSAVTGTDGFGPVSIAVLVALALFVAAAIWFARQPHLIPAFRRRIAGSAPARWTGEHIGRQGRMLARRFSVGEVAGVALLVGLVTVGALAATFTEVLEDVLNGEGIAVIDDPAAYQLAAHRDPWLTTTLKVVTALGNPPALAILVTVVCAVVLARSRSWLPVVLGAVGGAGIGLVIVTAKAVVGRDRPASPFAVISENGYSFPSGHAAGTAAVTLLCAWILSRWLITSWPGRVAVWSIAIGLTGAVGFSRVYLGVHYVSDVLAGWLLGAAWAGAVMLVGSWWDEARRARR